MWVFLKQKTNCFQAVPYLKSLGSGEVFWAAAHLYAFQGGRAERCLVQVFL